MCWSFRYWGHEGLGEQTENLPFKHCRGGGIKLFKKNKQVFVSERRGIACMGIRVIKTKGHVFQGERSGAFESS